MTETKTSWIKPEMIEKWKHRYDGYQTAEAQAKVGFGLDIRKYMEKDMVIPSQEVRKAIKRIGKTLFKSYIFALVNQLRVTGEKTVSVELVKSIDISDLFVNYEKIEKKVMKEAEKGFKKEKRNLVKAAKIEAKLIVLEAEKKKLESLTTHP